MNTPVPPSSEATSLPAEGLGALRVAVDTPSHLFNRTVPVEIRDENMALVQRTEAGREVPLPEGLYQVSAVLQDGIECRRIVKVTAGGTAQSVTLVADGAPDARKAIPMPASAPAASPQPAGAVPSPPPANGGMRTGTAPRVLSMPAPAPIRERSYTLSAEEDGASVMQRAKDVFGRIKSIIGGRAADSRASSRASSSSGQEQQEQQQQHQREQHSDAQATSTTAPPPPSIDPYVSVVQLQAATVVGSASGVWTLQGAHAGTGIANAMVRVGDTAWRISLPLGQASDQCLLRVDPGNARTPVTAWIAPERTMVAALQNMLLNGEYAALVPVAEQAIELLRSKYQDPTGAALGALILHKVGGLRPYASWLENLARDFPWIPDGDVLLASLLLQDGKQLDRALQLAISAASRRVLLAETYSILLDMLRRWPDRRAMAPHRGMVEDIARRGAYVAWGSLFFCHAEHG